MALRKRILMGSGLALLGIHGGLTWGQVLVRPATPRASEIINPERWPGWLGWAGRAVSGVATAESRPLLEARVELLGALLNARQEEQAFALAETLSGLPRYQAFARMALTGSERASDWAEEAKRGLVFLSARDQEQLVEDLIPVVSLEGAEAEEELIKRCDLWEDRAKALGAAAAHAARKGQWGRFDELVRRVEADKAKNEKPLVRLQIALAMVRLARALGPLPAGNPEEVMSRMEQLSGWATELAAGSEVNPCEVWYGLAEAWCLMGQSDRAAEPFARGLRAWRLWSPGSEERVHHLERLGAVAARSTKLAEGLDWVGTARAEAEKAFVDWKWQAWIVAGRLAVDFEDPKSVESLLSQAVVEARKNPNPEVRLACEAAVAMTAAEAGLELNAETIKRLGLTDASFPEREEGTSRD